MKRLILLAALAASGSALSAQAPAAAKAGDSTKAAAPASLLTSGVFDWNKMTVTPSATGERRNVFEGPTTTVDKLHCHITLLNPGKALSEPVLHLQEEIILVKEGLVEASIDGKLFTGGPGTVFFFAAHATTRMRNIGTVPATYFVVSYFTPLTPKS